MQCSAPRQGVPSTEFASGKTRATSEDAFSGRAPAARLLGDTVSPILLAASARTVPSCALLEALSTTLAASHQTAPPVLLPRGAPQKRPSARPESHLTTSSHLFMSRAAKSEPNPPTKNRSKQTNSRHTRSNTQAKKTQACTAPVIQLNHAFARYRKSAVSLPLFILRKPPRPLVHGTIAFRS
ncbi:hypothetical protein K458DRAFT_165944 [Lentithecium fluviatile CBS 122367]|uniref:Uncharacterized protein n=1 Tax=Lentithecium fluviatile CBS 122367 TaxID=1168545 RepID=A0A6G1IG37_9PLEO|nr:hypothetical protein K458DRAFT_165944 [Lentithecium fluviatile CBS 122367]